MAGMTKEELITVIKANSGLSEEHLAELAEKIKGSMIEEFNEKLAELTKKQDNKMKEVHLEEDEKKRSGWKSFGEQLQAVMLAGIPNAGPPDKRLVYHDAKAISGLNELVGAEGGFLVSPEYSMEILKIAHDVEIVAKDCRHLNISGNRLIINAINETSRATGSRWGGIQCYWVAEGGTATASKPSLRQIDLNLNKLMGVNYATEELLADQTALQDLTTQGFGEEFAFMIDDSIINGTGAGQPLGVRNSAALVSQSKEDEQDADTVVAENIANMWNRMPAKNRLKAKWYIIQDVEPQLFKMAYVMGTAAVPVFMPPVGPGTGGLVGSPNGTLFNRGIQTIEQCQALGDEGDILFLDLSQYLIIEKTGGLNATSSIHVRFLNDEQTFKFTYRLDGQPLWNSALTSYKGSVTRSPYVTLAVRA